MRLNTGETAGQVSFSLAEASNLPSILISAEFFPKLGRPALENAAYEG
jgi:hypothetical protein